MSSRASSARSGTSGTRSLASRADRALAHHLGGEVGVDPVAFGEEQALRERRSSSAATLQLIAFSEGLLLAERDGIDPRLAPR